MEWPPGFGAEPQQAVTRLKVRLRRVSRAKGTGRKACPIHEKSSAQPLTESHLKIHVSSHDDVEILLPAVEMLPPSPTVSESAVCGRTPRRRALRALASGSAAP